ncbi:MAG: glycosyltransferase family 9 protein [Pseudomonadota bacterium]
MKDYGPDGPRIAVLDSIESLGNAVYKFPFLRALKRAYPNSHVTWVVHARTSFSNILRDLTRDYVDEVMAGARIEKPFLKAIGKLRALPRFDIVYDMRSKFPRLIMSRIFMRYDRYITCTPGHLFTTGTLKIGHKRPTDWVTRYIDMVTVDTGKPADPSGFIPFPEDAVAEAKQLLPDGQRYVGFGTGSNGLERIWPLDRYIDVANHVTSKGCVPVFLMGPAEMHWYDEVVEKVPGVLMPGCDGVREDGKRDFPSIPLLYALAARLTVTVANDSGTGHLVGASGTALISLFGPTKPERFAPWADPLVCLRASTYGGNEMTDIPTEAVIETLDRFLDTGRFELPSAA